MKKSTHEHRSIKSCLNRFWLARLLLSELHTYGHPEAGMHSSSDEVAETDVTVDLARALE